MKMKKELPYSAKKRNSRGVQIEFEAAFAKETKTAYDRSDCSDYSSDNDDSDSETENEPV